MEATSSEAATRITLYVDPSCPFAWITSRWLLEVARWRPVETEFRVMSLSVLNEHRDIDAWYRDFNDRAWGPARIGAAVQERHGADAFAAYYGAYGHEMHTGGGEKRDVDRLEAAGRALSQAGLPAALSRAADDTDCDAVLRRTHDEVERLVGEESGTPVILIAGKAFFGPVCHSIPRAEQAVALFDGLRAAAQCDSFVELKRGRPETLTLT